MIRAALLSISGTMRDCNLYGRTSWRHTSIGRAGLAGARVLRRRDQSRVLLLLRVLLSPQARAQKIDSRVALQQQSIQKNRHH